MSKSNFILFTFNFFLLLTSKLNIITSNVQYTDYHIQRVTLFTTITLAFLGRFLYFLPTETEMNTPQNRVMYLLNSLMTS